MFLSKASEYAIKATIFIASKSVVSQQANLNEIVEAIDSPIAYTAKILQVLVKNDILESIRGAYGGFKINHVKLKELNLLDIVICIDGASILTRCVLGLNNCTSNDPCPLHEKYSELKTTTIATLKESSIKSLAQKFITHNTVLIN
jgi:Rrf2 family iron-sulfur cluster assembly transcriptional regulator